MSFKNLQCFSTELYNLSCEHTLNKFLSKGGYYVLLPKSLRCKIMTQTLNAY